MSLQLTGIHECIYAYYLYTTVSYLKEHIKNIFPKRKRYAIKIKHSSILLNLNIIYILIKSNKK